MQITRQKFLWDIIRGQHYDEKISQIQDNRNNKKSSYKYFFTINKIDENNYYQILFYLIISLFLIWNNFLTKKFVRIKITSNGLSEKSQNTPFKLYFPSISLFYSIKLPHFQQPLWFFPKKTAPFKTGLFFMGGVFFRSRLR